MAISGDCWVRSFSWLANAVTQMRVAGAFHAACRNPVFLLALGFGLGLFCHISLSELLTQLTGLGSSKLVAQISFVVYNDLCNLKKKKKKVKIRILSIFLLILFCSSVSRREGVTVYFHAILSKDFKLDPETHKVFIRAEGIAAYASWKDNICELHCTK